MWWQGIDRVNVGRLTCDEDVIILADRPPEPPPLSIFDCPRRKEANKAALLAIATPMP
jgi:hypothetical protein